WCARCIARRPGICSVAFSFVEYGAGAAADGAIGRVGVCCADGAVCDVADGADWVYGAAVVVDGAPAGFGVVGVCAQTGAAIAKAAAKVIPLKRWWFMVRPPDRGNTRRMHRPKRSIGEVLIPSKRFDP